MFRLEVHNSRESECSQWFYCYRHHQVTVWLWAIFPLWMWKGCKGISVNIWDSVIVSWNSFCSKWFFLSGMIWLDSDCNKWAAVRRTCCSLTDVNAKSYMCWREICSSGVASASRAKSHLLVKLCQCCQHCNSSPPFSPGRHVSLISHRQDQPQPSSSAIVAECSFDTM